MKDTRDASPRHRPEPQLASLGIAGLVGVGFDGWALASFELLTERHSPVRDEPAEPPQVSPSSQPGAMTPGRTDARAGAAGDDRAAALYPVVCGLRR